MPLIKPTCNAIIPAPAAVGGNVYLYKDLDLSIVPSLLRLYKLMVVVTPEPPIPSTPLDSTTYPLYLVHTRLSKLSVFLVTLTVIPSSVSDL